MKTERELKLEVALQKIVDATPANKPGEWHHHHWYLITAREALADEDAGGEDKGRDDWMGPTRMPEAQSVNTTTADKLAGEDAGGSDMLSETFRRVRESAPPQQRDALEAVDRIYASAASWQSYAARNHLGFEPIAGDYALVRHALTNPAVPTVTEAVRNFPDDMRREAARLDEAPGDEWAKARADVLRRRADELEAHLVRCKQ